MEMVERLRGENRAEETQEEKVLARSDPLFAEGDALPEARSLSPGPSKICALDVLRTLIYSWSSALCMTSSRGVSFFGAMSKEF